MGKLNDCVLALFSCYLQLQDLNYFQQTMFVSLLPFPI